MIQIYIDSVLKTKARIFASGLFNRPDIRMEKAIPRLEKLRDKLRPLKDKKYREYLNLLINNYDIILISTPSEMGVWIKEFEKILPQAKLYEKKPYKKYSFWESIVIALRYTDLQKVEFPNYMRKENIKACVYCNSQFTLSVVSEFFDKNEWKRIKKIRPRYQIDHYYPKSKYPYLATSFFNLYPSCSSCNNVKLEKKAEFQLYSENSELIDFQYHLDEDDVFEYFISNGASKVRITVGPNNGNIDLKENHENLFCIQGIANEQQDLIEELLLKSKIYTPSYKQILVDSLETIFPDKSIIDRLIIGNYNSTYDVHKRPFSKLTQDIARQLNII